MKDDAKQCRKARDLLLARARGSSLGAEDAQFLKSHLGECDACAEDGELHGLLAYGSAADSPAEELSAARRNAAVRAAVDAFMREDRPAAPVTARPPRAAPAAALAAAALIFIAAAYLIMTMGAGPGRRESGNRIVSVACQGKVSVDGKAARPGSILREKSAISVEDGFFAYSEENHYTLYIRENSSLVIGEIKDGRRSVSVGRGYIIAKVSPGSSKAALEMRVGQFTILDRGTIFSIEAGPSGSSVRVLEGEVSVRSKAGGEVFLKAGRKLWLAGSMKTSAALTQGEREDDLDVIRQVDATGGFAKKKGAGVIGEPFLKPGSEPAPAGGGPAAGQPPAGLKSPTGLDAQAPAGLLQLARQQRSGKDWDGALDAYARLIADYPSSGEAQIALISMGEIFLENKGKPGKALDYFKKYRAGNPKGPLLEETWYGIISCYKKMGKDSMEAGEIRAFLKKFPSSIYGQKLRARLKDLEGSDAP